MKTYIIAYLLLVVATSLMAFALFGFDKRQARLGRRRVPEKSLHWFAFVGGWPGALAGQRFFRHKTQKLSFRIVFWLVVVLHLAVVLGAGYCVTAL
jgi:uncharacterized membrane protein YsdA (DUF1294 family)